MNWVVNQALNNANLNQHTILRRYFDDLVFTLINEAQRNDVFQHTAKAIFTQTLNSQKK